MAQYSNSAPQQPSQQPSEDESTLERELPRLPVEIIYMIFSELGATLKQPTPSSWRTNPGSDYHQFEQTIRALTLLRPLSSLARSILFDTLLVSSDNRATGVNKALEQSFLHPAYRDEEGVRHPAWREKGYLKQLVKAVHITISERKNPKNPAGPGVTPQAIRKLAAAALPELGTLDISAKEKGGYIDGDIIQALRGFKKVRSMEIQGTGYSNAAGIFAELERLEDLKLQGLGRGFVGLFYSSAANARFLALPRPPTPTLFGAQLRTLVLVRVSLDPASTLPELFTSSGLNPLILQHLIVSKVVGPPALTISGCPSFAIPPEPFQLALQPFVAHLRTFHLDLFDVPPVTSRDARLQLTAQRLYKNGQLVLPDSGHRPATFLAPHFGQHLDSLTVGGPMNLHGAEFFHQLSNSPARIKHLTLVQCAQNSAKSVVAGITPDEVVEALDTEWATQLERIDIVAMEQSLYDDELEEVEAWGWEAVVKIEEKLRELEAARRKGGVESRIELVHKVRMPEPARRASSSSKSGKRIRDDEEEGGKKKKSSKK